MQIGFSTGALYKFCTIKEALNLYKKHNIKTVELGVLKIDSIKKGLLGQITKEDLNYFDYVSFHAPKFEYRNDIGTMEIFEQISKINKLRKLNLVVFHPDSVQDFKIFDNVDFPIAFENMDDRKLCFKKAEEILKIPQNNFHIVLDLNHIYVNDRSMSLASAFYKLLGDKIAEYHISGNIESHDPIYKTKQVSILKWVKDKSHPAIIESVITPEEILLELNYVKKILQ